MTDKIPSFKDQIDDIHVPTEKLDDIILKTVQEHAPKRKKSWRSSFFYSASAAVVALGILIGSATVSPVMADIVSKIPLIGSVFSESDDVGLAQVSDLGLTQVVGQSKTVKGDTITIDEVFYDGTRLTVSYSLESQEPLSEHYFFNKSANIDFTIDGKSVSSGGSIGETEVSPTYRTGIYEIGAVDLPNEFNLGLTFKGEDKKKWKFKFPVKTQIDLEVVDLNHTQTADSIELNVPHVKISAAGLNFNFQAVAEENNHLAMNIDFKIVDNFGNEVSSHSGPTQSTINKGVKHISGYRIFDPIADDVKELIVTPYLQLPTGGGGVEFDKDGNETEIEFEPYDGEEIEFESFTVNIPKNN